jgi:urease accessory protein
VLPLPDGGRVLIDLTEATVLHDGDELILDDGSRVRVAAAEEDLFDVFPQSPEHLTELAWHIGNRHLAAEIRSDRIRILRDHVIRDMLEKMGAKVEDTRGRFVPVRGAYSTGAGHHHNHGHGHSH